MWNDLTGTQQGVLVSAGVIGLFAILHLVDDATTPEQAGSTVRSPLGAIMELAIADLTRHGVIPGTYSARWVDDGIELGAPASQISAVRSAVHQAVNAMPDRPHYAVRENQRSPGHIGEGWTIHISEKGTSPITY